VGSGPGQLLVLTDGAAPPLLAWPLSGVEAALADRAAANLARVLADAAAGREGG
jgi:hypothetical protein